MAPSSRCAVRHTDFVEVMFPIMRACVFEHVYTALYVGQQSDWGLDKLWCRYFERFEPWRRGGDDAVDDVFGVIDRGGREDVETDHTDQAEKDQALVGQDQGDQPDEGGSFLFVRFTHILNLLPVGPFTGILELDSCLGKTVPDHVRTLEILFFTELIP